MSGNSYRYRQLRTRLWHEDPHCRYCGVLTILPEHLPKNKSGHVIERPNMATIDHIRSRWDPARWEPNPTCERRRELSCKKCNCEWRNQQDMKDKIDLVRQKSRSFPIGENVHRLANALEAALESGSWNLLHEMSSMQVQVG